MRYLLCIKLEGGRNSGGANESAGEKNTQMNLGIIVCDVRVAHFRQTRTPTYEIIFSSQSQPI